MVLMISVPYYSPQQLASTQQVVEGAEGGYAQLNNMTWLVATNATASDWRDILRDNLGVQGIIVAPITRRWSTYGSQAINEWLRDVRDWF